MWIKKNGYIIAAIILCSYLYGRRSFGMFEYLYFGVSFHDVSIFYMLYFSSMVLFAVSFFRDFCTYIENDVVYSIIRNKNRTKIYMNLELHILKKIFVFEICKIIGFVIIAYLSFGKVYIENIEVLVHSMFIYILLEWLLINIMMYIELFYGPQQGVLFVCFYFILSLSIGDVLSQMKNIPDFVYYLLLPNVAMYNRIDQLMISPYTVMVLELLIGLIIIFMGIKKMQRKDIL